MRRYNRKGWRSITPEFYTLQIAGNWVVRAVGVDGRGSYGGRERNLRFQRRWRTGDTSVAGPFDLTFDARGNMLITDLYTNRIREVLETGRRCSVSGGPGIHGTGSRSAADNLRNGLDTEFRVGATVASGSNWLSVTPASANAPAEIQVTADPSGLAAGLSGTVNIQAPYENPPALRYR